MHPPPFAYSMDRFGRVLTDLAPHVARVGRGEVTLGGPPGEGTAPWPSRTHWRTEAPPLAAAASAG